MPAQEPPRPVFLPVIIGTPRQGRLTEPAANFVFGEASKRSDIKTELIDIRKISIRTDDAGEALKDKEFCATLPDGTPCRAVVTLDGNRLVEARTRRGVNEIVDKPARNLNELRMTINIGPVVNNVISMVD